MSVTTSLAQKGIFTVDKHSKIVKNYSAGLEKVKKCSTISERNSIYAQIFRS